MDNKEKCTPDSDGGIKRKVMELAEEISREVNQKFSVVSESSSSSPQCNEEKSEK